MLLSHFSEEFAELAAKVGTGRSETVLPATDTNQRGANQIGDLLLRPPGPPALFPLATQAQIRGRLSSF